MESQCHRGSELKEIRAAAKACSSCGSVAEGKLTGYRCKVDGNYHDIDGVQREFIRKVGTAKITLKVDSGDDMDKPQVDVPEPLISSESEATIPAPRRRGRASAESPE